MQGFTIDDRHTRDIDDAIWVERKDDGWRVTVAIADVAACVEDGHPVDIQARLMVETKYFVSGNSPMLPRDLSEDRLSLWPNQKRDVIAVHITLDNQLEQTAIEFEVGKLISKQKFAYTDIPNALTSVHPCHMALYFAHVLSQSLLKKRRDAGALALYDLNHGWITTEEGFLRQIVDHDAAVGQIIVQEFMILANAAVAKWAIEHDVPILFRNHVARLATPDRSELMQQLDDATRSPIAGLDALRQRTHMLLDRATYGASVRGHYGLNLPAYTHFTSPIRRYADLITHRQIRASLLGEPLPYTRDKIALFGTHITETLDAERVAQSQYMKDNADRRANRAIDSRRLDGLNHKDFERVTKVEARDGGEPSEVFEEAFVRRTNDDKTPLIALTVLFTQAPVTEAWKPLREAAMAALVRRPEDAVSLLAQATQVTDGWPAVKYVSAQIGPSFKPRFEVTATLTHNGISVSAVGTSKQKKKADQRAAVALIAAFSQLPAPSFENVNEPDAASVDVVVSKDPISALSEWAQRAGVAAPTFEFESSGPQHASVIVCTARLVSHVARGTANTKQMAKRLASQELLRRDLVKT